MRRLALTIAACALLGASPAAIAAPAAKPAIRLTPIDNVFSGASCLVSLRQNDQQIVAGMDYIEDDGAWRVGINGKNYRMTDLAVKSPHSVLVSKDRKITVRFKRGKRVWVSRDPGYPAETHQVSVTVTSPAGTGVFTVFQTCGDG